MDFKELRKKFKEEMHIDKVQSTTDYTTREYIKWLERQLIKNLTTPVAKKLVLTYRAVGLILGGAAFFNALFYFIKSMFF